MPGSTFGGLTVVSRLASGAGWMTPLGGTEDAERLSGIVVARSEGVWVRVDGDPSDDTSAYAGGRPLLSRQMMAITRSIEDLLTFPAACQP